MKCRAAAATHYPKCGEETDLRDGGAKKGGAIGGDRVERVSAMLVHIDAPLVPRCVQNALKQ